MVVNSRGHRNRFLRGIVTHDLMQRGVRFDDAYAVARALRDRLSQRESVSSQELRDLITEQVERQLGKKASAGLRFGVERPRAERYVVDGGEHVPFSRGVLAASIGAVGLDLDRAYRVIGELEESLRNEDVTELTSREVAQRVGEILERLENPETARRYRLMRSLRHLPRPLVVLIGGASGTGKSTLALELAPILRIYRLNATDTIRQVMRMVFSPEILPALHTSSFELGAADDFADRSAETDLEERLIASFEEQSIRVNVGVRAVVERSIAENMSVIVEGVHLCPPLIPFADLEGAAYQVPMILSLPDPEVHRTRFLARSRRGTRHAERYMAHFQAIRWQHDFLLQQADTHDVAFLDTSYDAPPVPLALQLITSLLERRLPRLALGDEREALTPSLLIILDGLADRPSRTLGGRTPLAAAQTPHLDRLALEGACGLADPIAPGVVPDTAAGSLALFGQSPLAMLRGPIEALGAGLKLRPGDIALRGNFATLDEEGRVLDRRAGRIRESTAELAEALNDIQIDGVTIRVRQATEHRLAVILRGKNLSPEIHGSDPGDGAPPGPPLKPRPTEEAGRDAARTADFLASFEKKARKVLASHPVNASRRQRGLPEANTILTRGAGQVHRLLPLEDAGTPLQVACIAGDRTILGLAEWLGAETIREKSMTANLDTDLRRKFQCARETLQKKDLVVLHLKGADIAAHDRRPDLKTEFLERVDQELGRFLKDLDKDQPLRIAVASDHATLSESGQHAADPLPVILWGTGVKADEVERFDENSTATGALRRFPLQTLMRRLIGSMH